MANKILVVLEQRENQLKKISFEAAKAGSNLANKLGCDVEGVIVGNDALDLATVGGFGVSKVTLLKNSDLVKYSSSAYAKIIAEFASEVNANILIFGNTSLGKDLAPKVSVKINAGIAMDAVVLDFVDGNIVATRPIYAGKALIDVKVNSENKIFTIRPNVFNAGESSGNNAEVIEKSIDAPDLATKVIEVKKAEGKLDVAEASIIVSGGRGLKEAENFKLVEDLAEVLGAAVGASRAVVDAGWRPHAEQVGQTGKTVSPNLYVALGISGAIQHLAGMRSSKYIVAINKDADAPIFQVADYGITGDVFEVVPALIEELKK
ncbi:MAG: electron transfer flavoprotein subunit alpha/FixB family protein [Melioribacteraceae bacterium]|nr:electron transfer flavoprotein subunit alpha/FixB family protein [Melioribacteraceae bacterium]